MIGSSRSVISHVGEQLFIDLSFPHDLLWNFCVCQDGEDDGLPEESDLFCQSN